MRKIKGWMTALALAGTVSLSGGRAAAQDAFANTPADAYLSLLMPDSAASWERIAKLPLVEAATRWIDDTIAANADLKAEMDSARAQAIEQLGFDPTAQELMANTFSSLALNVLPANPNSDGLPLVQAELGVKDSGRVQKLLAALEENFESLAADAAAEVTLDLESVVLGGIDALHITAASAEGMTLHGYLGMAAERLLFSSNAASFEDLTAQKQPAQSLSNLSELAQARQNLPVEGADWYGWVAAKSIERDLSAATGGGVQGVNPYTQNALYTGRIMPNGVQMDMLSMQDPQLLVPDMPIRNMRSLKMIAQRPLFAMAMGLLNLEELRKPEYQELTSMAEMMMAGTGFSLMNELIPAIGNEASLSVNKLGMNPANPLVPLVDVLLAVEVRDRTKMEQIMGKVETLIAQQAGQLGSGGGAFRAHGTDPSIRVYDSGIPSLSPAYKLDGQYLMFSLNPEGIAAAEQRLWDKAPALTQSPVLEALRAGGTPNDAVFSFSTIDFGRFCTEVITPVYPLISMQLAATDPQASALAYSLLTQVAPKFGSMSSANIRRDGKLFSRMLWKME